MNLQNYKSIATVSLSGTLLEKLNAISNAGFSGIEICENDLLSSKESPEKIAKMIEDFGLKNLLFQPFRDFEGCPRENMQQNLDRARHKFDLMSRLNVDTMLLCSNVGLNTIKDDQVIIDDLSLLAEYAASYKIKIGYEALSWGVNVNSYIHAWEIVQKVNHYACGIILDSFHTLARNDNLTDLITLDKEKIFFVQLADAPYLNTNLLNWSRHFRCYPGDGDLNITEFVKNILQTGYDGPLSLEIFSDKLQAMSPRVAAFDGILSFRYLENHDKLQLYKFNHLVA